VKFEEGWFYISKENEVRREGNGYICKSKIANI